MRRFTFLTVPTVRHDAADVATVQAIHALPKHERAALWQAMSEVRRRRLKVVELDLEMATPEFNRGKKAEAEKRMAKIDAFDAETRAAVNKHGLPAVQTCWDFGIRKGNRIDHLLSLLRGEQTNGLPAAFGNRRPGAA